MDNTFAKNLKKFRLAKNYTQEQVADRLNVSSAKSTKPAANISGSRIRCEKGAMILRRKWQKGTPPKWVHKRKMLNRGCGKSAAPKFNYGMLFYIYGICPRHFAVGVNDGRADIAVIVSEVKLGMCELLALPCYRHTGRVTVGVEAYFGAG